jgi:hypothetical protein
MTSLRLEAFLISTFKKAGKNSGPAIYIFLTLIFRF